MLVGSTVWDPLLICAQIVTIQCLFYLSLGLWECALAGVFLHRLTVGHLWTWSKLNMVSWQGWSLVLANLLNAPVGSVYLIWIVERAKKCLDFAVTCYIIHLIACCFYAGFPLSWEWWVVNLLSMAVMALLGEWLCVRREMQDIPISQTNLLTRAK